MVLSLFKKNILGIFIFFALFTANASAAIVSKGDYMQDDKTSLDWLKVTKTQAQSYNEILKKLAVGGDLNGWPFATQAELVAAPVNGEHVKNSGIGNNEILKKLAVGGDLNGWPFATQAELVAAPVNGEHVKNSGIGNLMNYTRGTQSGYKYIYGYVAEDCKTPYVYMMRLGVNPNNGKGSFEKKFKHRTKIIKSIGVGAFLERTSAVTTVSEPASRGLFGLGLIGIAAFSRRCRLS